MSVQRKPGKPTPEINESAANNFISGANVPAPTKLKKIPVALRFAPQLLKAIDAVAGRRGMSRNALISYWCSKAIESE